MIRKTDRKQLVIFFVSAFGLAWVIQVLASYFANQGNIMIFQLLLMVCMFMPLLATVIARIPIKGMGWVPHLKGKFRFLFFALWMPMILSVVSALFYFLIFPDQYDAQFETMKLALGAEGLTQLEAQGMTLELYLIVTTIAAVTYAPFFNMFFALGEEVGWRGALYPALKERFGKTWGRVIGGICWGVWHWPVIILAGYEYGTDYLGAPFLGPVVFCLSAVFCGILHDYVYEKTGTIWMPALFHGAINAATVFAYMLKPEYQDRIILGPVWIGLIGMVPMVVLAVAVSLLGRKEKAVQ